MAGPTEPDRAETWQLQLYVGEDGAIVSRDSDDSAFTHALRDSARFGEFGASRFARPILLGDSTIRATRDSTNPAGQAVGPRPRRLGRVPGSKPYAASSLSVWLPGDRAAALSSTMDIFSLVIL